MADANSTKAAPPASSVAGSDESIAATLKEMTESQRQLVSAALDAMQKRLDAAEESANLMKTENETLKSAQQVDKALLESQIKSFITQVGKERSAQFGLSEETCKNALASDSPGTIRHNVERMLLCCNTAMMAMRANQVAQENAASNVTAATQESTDAAAPVNENKKRPAEHFEPTEEDAGSRLRKIMQSF